MKKFLSLVLCLCMLLPLLAGCGGNGDSTDNKDGKITIEYMTWAAGGQKVALQKTIAAFNESHPDIHVKATFVPSGYLSRLQTLLAGKKEPDICALYGNYVRDWANNGVLTSLDPFLDNSSIDRTDILPVAQYEHNGSLYGLASGVGTVLVYYNKQIFADAGVTDEDIKDWTWDEFVEIMHKVTVDQNGNHPKDSGFDLDNVKTWGCYVPKASYINEPLLWSNGGGYFEPDGSGVAVDRPESIEVLQKMVDLIYVDHVSPTAADTAGTSSQVRQLQNGNVACFISGVYEMATFHSEGWYDYGVALLPIFDKQIGQVWGESQVIFESCENKEAAFTFLEYLMNPEVNMSLLLDGSQMPSFRSWYTDPEKFALWTNNDCHVEEFREIIPEFVPNCLATRSIYYIKNSDAVGQHIWNALDKSYLSNEPIAEVVAGLDKMVAPYLQGVWATMEWMD